MCARYRFSAVTRERKLTGIRLRKTQRYKIFSNVLKETGSWHVVYSLTDSCESQVPHPSVQTGNFGCSLGKGDRYSQVQLNLFFSRGFL